VRILFAVLVCVVAYSDAHAVTILETATGQAVQRLRGHPGEVHYLAYAPNGKTLATAGKDPVVLLWNPETGTVRSRLSGHQGAVVHLAFSPDGRTLATASADGTAILWDVAKGVRRQHLKGHGGALTQVAFAPGGALLVTGSQDRTLRLWRVTDGGLKATLEGHGAPIQTVAYAPDGKTVAAGNGREVTVWDVAKGQIRHRLAGHDGDLLHVAYSPDSRQIAAAGYDPVTTLWDVQSGKAAYRLSGHKETIRHLAYAPNDFRMATAGIDERLILWDRETGNQLAFATGHDHGLYFVTYDPQGERIASAGYDRATVIWNAKTAEVLHRFQANGGDLANVAFSPDGRHLATSGVYAKASFNCEKAGSALEHAICDDFGLTELDGMMGRLYFSVRKRLSQMARIEQKKAHRAWLKSRKVKCASAAPDCLIPLYEARIAALTKVDAALTAAFAQVKGLRGARGASDCGLRAWMIAGDAYDEFVLETTTRTVAGALRFEGLGGDGNFGVAFEVPQKKKGPKRLISGQVAHGNFTLSNRVSGPVPTALFEECSAEEFAMVPVSEAPKPASLGALMATLKKAPRVPCDAVSDFDVEAFLAKNGGGDRYENFLLWALAEEAAKTNRFGPPSHALVLSLVCNGGNGFTDTDSAVEAVVTRMMSGAPPAFDICDHMDEMSDCRICNDTDELAGSCTD